MSESVLPPYPTENGNSGERHGLPRLTVLLWLEPSLTLSPRSFTMDNFPPHSEFLSYFSLLGQNIWYPQVKRREVCFDSCLVEVWVRSWLDPVQDDTAEEKQPVVWQWEPDRGRRKGIHCRRLCTVTHLYPPGSTFQYHTIQGHTPVT